MARILRPTRAKGDDNPRLGGVVFRSEVALPATPTPSRGAYFRKEALPRGAYSPPNPSWEGGGSWRGKRPNVARILRPTRAVRDDNPRLGGAVFMREAPPSGAYSAPYPRFWEDNPRWGGVVV